MQQSTPTYTSSPEDEAEFEELQKVVEGCLAQIPERCRNIFLMHRDEGLKYTEIATRLDISVKTVEANMSKALALLRKEIETYYKE